eukprot:TRINITY_DN17087_c0_g1_i1.p1 TRINITY_DN17087_c0_g1~~TRINITY_DN17087_c0_g1_i1.p1  ORF type:complete len:385 (+),score=96.90 TRINITY_DN17087_c0_g1_i1:96-1250(+)
MRQMLQCAAMAAVAAASTPACVLSPSGKMLCCAENDSECLKKVQVAHGEPDGAAGADGEQPVHRKLIGAMPTFANSTLWDHQSPFDVVVIGVPHGLDAGYDALGLQLLRRETSRMSKYSRAHDVSIDELNIVDVQDVLVAGEGSVREKELESALRPYFQMGRPVLALGGDQSITLPLLKAAHSEVGAFALIHIDKDLSTGSGSGEESLDKSSALFWAAAQNVIETRHSLHVGVRGNLPSRRVDLVDQELGFQSVLLEDIVLQGVAEAVERIKTRLMRRDGTFVPAYISVDMDVLDPVYYPAADNLEVGGLSVNQLRALLVGLRPFCRVVGAELRGVAALTEPASAVRVAAAVAQDLALLAGRQNLLGTEITSPPLKAGGSGVNV